MSSKVYEGAENAVLDLVLSLQKAVQTNPQTGVRQIIAIPINAVQAATSSAAGSVVSGNMSIFSTAGGGQQRINVSPMKVCSRNFKSFQTKISLSLIF